MKTKFRAAVLVFVVILALFSILFIIPGCGSVDDVITNNDKDKASVSTPNNSAPNSSTPNNGGTGNKTENNPSTPTPVPEKIENFSITELMKKQSAAPERRLLQYGFKDTELTFRHKIGTVNEAFVGYLTDVQHYSGTSTASISYTKSVATTNARDWSITNISMQTNEIRTNISVEAKPFGIGVGVELGVASSWSNGTEISMGTSFSQMIEKASTYTYDLVPSMGIGYYSVVAFAKYSVYQTTTYSLKTNSIIQSELCFLNSPEEPGMDIYLVKASERSEFNDVLKKITPGLSKIKSLTQQEIDLCKKLARENIKSSYSIKWGNETLYNDTWFSSAWSSYSKLDTITKIFGNDINIDLLKFYYSKVQLDLTYTYHCGSNSSNVRIQMKIVNQSTGDQFCETPEHLPNGQYTATIDLSKFKSSDLIEFEVRQRKINGWGDGGIRFYAGRQYNFSFS